jgi:hypothetical protein
MTRNKRLCTTVIAAVAVIAALSRRKREDGVRTAV